IAKRIGESLQAKITGREEQGLAVKPTNNPAAYEAYLRGLAYDGRVSMNYDAENVIRSYERAVQLDPDFALAWARLSRINAFLSFGDNDPVGRDAAKRALENAQRLAPNSPETLLALGYYQHLVLRDYELTKNTFKHVIKLLPGGSEAPYALGRVARREGR